jgi:GNAT superfamily N-acetyltransferase
VSFRLRLARARDVPLLVAHRRLMLELEDSGEGTPAQFDAWEPRYAAWLRQELRAKRLRAYLAVDARGRALASGLLWLREAPPRPWLKGTRQPYVTGMFVLPDARGQGIATAITQAMVDWSEARGYQRIALHASEAGKPIYAKAGFEPSFEYMVLKLPRTAARARRKR